jgi:hypothetical protein
MPSHVTADVYQVMRAAGQIEALLGLEAHAKVVRR